MSNSNRDVDRRSAHTAARRAAARKHHPDRGGDAEAFIRALRDIDARFGESDGRGGSDVQVRSTVVSRNLRRLRTSGRTTVRRIRSSIPRSWPGSRRYGRL